MALEIKKGVFEIVLLKKDLDNEVSLLVQDEYETACVMVDRDDAVMIISHLKEQFGL